MFSSDSEFRDVLAQLEGYTDADADELFDLLQTLSKAEISSDLLQV
jgi:hypothetical protein